MRFSIFIATSLVILNSYFSAASPTSATQDVVVAPTSSRSDGNVVSQLFGYARDSVVRTVTGTKEMWANHGRCKEIRAKQKDFREKLKSQWELQEKNLTPQDMKRRLASVNGGITYDEFVFLAKGKEDRGKLMNMIFLMWGAPRLFPYALMFYPNMLPGPFAPLPDASGKETKLEKLSRQRAHAVIQSFINIEKEAKSIPAAAKLNIFGRKKQQERMDVIDSLGKSVSAVLIAEDARKGRGADIVLEQLDSLLFKKEKMTRGEKRLIQVPQAAVVGLMSSISGPGPLTGLTPNFMRRGNVVAHVQKVAEADNFLVNEQVDLESLQTARLLEACNDRMIGGNGRSDDEMRQDLSKWLDLAVVQPKERSERTNENFNENLARAALMGYFSVDAARDPRCTSYLTRSMFQGQLCAPTRDGETKKRER